VLRDAENTGGSCEPHLLYSANEYDQLRGMLRIAHGDSAAAEL
jgi:hypothetical protein